MIFRTEDDVINWVKQNYSEEQLSRLRISQNGSSNVPWAFIAYKGILSEKINGILRDNPNEIETDEKLKEFQELICGYSIPTEIKVYRFVSWKEYCWLMKKTRWGKVCTYNGFLSTTLLAGRYRELYNKALRRIVIEISVPQGAKGTYLPEVNPYLPEFEILFPHGTKLKKIGMDKYTVITD